MLWAKFFKVCCDWCETESFWLVLRLFCSYEDKDSFIPCEEHNFFSSWKMSSFSPFNENSVAMAEKIVHLCFSLTSRKYCSIQESVYLIFSVLLNSFAWSPALFPWTIRLLADTSFYSINPVPIYMYTVNVKVKTVSTISGLKP